MLKYTDYDIVFQEIPDETTLAVNLSMCPNRCPGCHSPQLWDDIGEVFDEQALDSLIVRYGSAVTCISLMGGDNDPAAVDRMAQYIQSKGYKSAWYSGRPELPGDFTAEHFNYVKTGPYIVALGGLDHATTNQRLYRIENNRLTDITARMQKK